MQVTVLCVCVYVYIHIMGKLTDGIVGSAASHFMNPEVMALQEVHVGACY